MSAQIRQFIAFLKQSIWLTELTDLPGWRVRLIQITRVLFAVVRDLAEGQLTLRAMSLVYATLLSLVPVLAVSFSVLKAFGGHNQIEPMLNNLFAPLGEKGVEITANIIGFVDNMKVGILGALGVSLLFYTVIALMQKIEAAFNYTWRVTQTRPLHQRFSDYLSVLMIGPVLVFSALGLTGTMMSNSVVQWLSEIELFGELIRFATRLVPYMLIIGAFTFIYIFMPNTRVKTKSAFIGALVAGALWLTTGWAFASFVVSSGNYTAIYSAFATLILLLIWLYLGWLILLVGASIAFYHQNPDYVSSPRREPKLSNRMKERLTLLVMARIADRFYHDKPACSAKDLAMLLRTPSDIIVRVLDALESQNLIRQTNDKTPLYLPAQPLEEMSIKHVLDAIRQADEDEHLNPNKLVQNSQVDQVFTRMSDSLEETLSQQTVKDLVLRNESQ